MGFSPTAIWAKARGNRGFDPLPKGNGNPRGNVMKNEIITVTEARYVRGYTLDVTFSDGLRCEIDYLSWIAKYPHFAPLKNLDYFRNFSLDGWTIVWPNGADVAADTLHKTALVATAFQPAGLNR